MLKKAKGVWVCQDHAAKLKTPIICESLHIIEVKPEKLDQTPGLLNNRGVGGGET